MDIERPEELVSYLRETGRIALGERPHVHVLTGGVSNRTVLVKRPTGEAWVLKQALPKLRVESDWFSDPQRIHREALGLRWLRKLARAGTITPLVFEDHDHHLLAMEAVPEPHENWKVMLLEGRLREEHVERFGTLLAEIHREACRPPERREEVAMVFRDRSFFESLRLEPYYAYTATQVPAAAEFLHALIRETRARRDTLVHGDYSPKNVLIHDTTLVLLDHEVIHFGDPAFDLGFSLTHFLSKAHYLLEQRGAFAQAAELYWQIYREEAGGVSWAEELDPRTVRHTLGCLLARVAGRSPLEYLDDPERARQREVVLTLIRRAPATTSELIDEFVGRL